MPVKLVELLTIARDCEWAIDDPEDPFESDLAD